MTVQRDRAWVGIDVGKTHHWACVVDAGGRKLLSIKVGNDEADVVALIATATSQAKQPDWAADIIGAPSALLLAPLDRAGQRAHGATHTQAVIALARRRIDVLWALIRENRTWTAAPPSLTQAA
jgi:hypothetical protein